MFSQHKERLRINLSQIKGSQGVSKKKRRQSRGLLNPRPRASLDHKGDALKSMSILKSLEPLMWSSRGLSKRGGDSSVKPSNKRTSSYQRWSLRKLTRSRTRSHGGRSLASGLMVRARKSQSMINLKYQHQPQANSKNRQELREGSNQRLRFSSLLLRYLKINSQKNKTRDSKGVEKFLHESLTERDSLAGRWRRSRIRTSLGQINLALDLMIRESKNQSSKINQICKDHSKAHSKNKRRPMLSSYQRSKCSSLFLKCPKIKSQKNNTSKNKETEKWQNRSPIQKGSLASKWRRSRIKTNRGGRNLA